MSPGSYLRYGVAKGDAMGNHARGEKKMANQTKSAKPVAPAPVEATETPVTDSKFTIVLPVAFAGKYTKQGVENVVSFDLASLTADQVAAFAWRGMHEIVTNVSWIPRITDPDNKEGPVIDNPMSLADATKVAFFGFMGEGKSRLTDEVKYARECTEAWLTEFGGFGTDDAGKLALAAAKKLVVKSLTRAVRCAVDNAIKGMDTAPDESQVVAMVKHHVDSLTVAGAELAEAKRKAKAESKASAIDFSAMIPADGSPE